MNFVCHKFKVQRIVAAKWGRRVFFYFLASESIEAAAAGWLLALVFVSRAQIETTVAGNIILTSPKHC